MIKSRKIYTDVYLFSPSFLHTFIEIVLCPGLKTYGVKNKFPFQRQPKLSLPAVYIDNEAGNKRRCQTYYKFRLASDRGIDEAQNGNPKRIK